MFRCSPASVHRAVGRLCRRLATAAAACGMLGAPSMARASERDICSLLTPQPVQFRFGTGARPSPPVIAPNGAIYVGTSEGYLHALASDGTYRWSYTLKGPVTGRPALGDYGVVLVPTARRIYAVRPEGTLSWVFDSPVRIVGDLLRDSAGRFYFASDDGRLFLLSDRGALITHIPGRASFSTLPVALADGGVAAGRADGSVVLARPGKRTLTFQLGKPAEVLFGCPNSSLCAITNGSLRVLGATSNWEPAASRGASTGQRVALLADERRLQVYQGISGELRASLELPDAASGAPLVDRLGRIFVPLRNGAVISVSAEGRLNGCTRIARSPIETLVADEARKRLLATASEGVLAALSTE